MLVKNNDELYLISDPFFIDRKELIWDNAPVADGHGPFLGSLPVSTPRSKSSNLA